MAVLGMNHQTLRALAAFVHMLDLYTNTSNIDDITQLMHLAIASLYACTCVSLQVCFS